ncbi:MAG: class II aldolase/adducin family protein [Bacillota bacterium]|nr:class II aldolase/adducin family protein [Bacillota bacterium]
MDNVKAKEMVVKAGKRLVREGLIARTWGNVSCRLSDTLFAITPSGRPYEKLTSEDIVIMNLDDLSYEGRVEPSSEKGVHAAVYRQRRDINFIIHTHQYYASAISSLQTDIEIEEVGYASLIGDRIVSIPYGMPGSKKLSENVATTMSRSKGKAYIMTAHGALCLGVDSEEAFQIAERLEEICANYILRWYSQISKVDSADWPSLRNYYISRKSGKENDYRSQEPVSFYNSKRENDGFIFSPADGDDKFFSFGNGRSLLISPGQGFQARTEEELDPLLFVHHAIYLSNPAVKAIRHVLSPNVLAFSMVGKKMYPMLDDFAQIVGEDVPLLKFDPANFHNKISRQIAGLMKRRSAVLLAGGGALCCGLSLGDALAAAMIMEKNAMAIIVSCIFNRGRPLNLREARLMRTLYLENYSLKATR